MDCRDMWSSGFTYRGGDNKQDEEERCHFSASGSFSMKTRSTFGRDLNESSTVVFGRRTFAASIRR